MRSLLLIISIIVCCFIASFSASAQETMHFDSYGVDEGLLQSSVWGIAQDKNGFLWISTSDGVCRFDGYEFTPCDDLPGGRKSISGALCADSKGNIWFKHFIGLSKYDAQLNRVVKIYEYKERTSYDYVFGEDSKGFVWVGIAEAGLLKIDNSSNRIVQTVSLNGSPIARPSRINSGIVDKQNRIWITQSAKGLVCYDISAARFDRYMDTITAVWTTSVNDSTLLVSSVNKLYLFNTTTKHIVLVDQSHWPQDNKIVVPIISSAKDKDNNIWLCTTRGIYIYDPRSASVKQHITSFSESVRNYNNVLVAAADASGNMWVGTDGDGLKKLPNNTKKFRTYPRRTQGGNMVKAIEADDQKIYVGYFDNGMDIYDRKERAMRHIDKTAFPGHSIYAITSLDSSNKLLLLDNEDVALFNCRSGKVTDLRPLMYRDIPGDLVNRESRSFLIKSPEHFVYFGRDDKLVQIRGSNPRDMTFRVIHAFDQELLHCAFISTKGIMYVGTVKGFYYRVNEDGPWLKGDMPPGAWVKKITEDKAGNILVGTIDGIYIYGPDHKLQHYFNEKNLLRNNYIYEMSCDKDGKMWISHNKGLSVYDPTLKAFHHYSKEDGLPSNEFNTGASFQAADGELFFGGINGITSFYPGEILNNQVLPRVQITKIKLLDEPLRSDTGYLRISTLSLPYNKNTLSFEFAAMEFTNSSRNQYAYMMEGVDPGWIQSGSKRFARYANIPPGHYTFRVKASNNDGIWSPEYRRIYITITPPYWQRSWFIVILLLACIGVIVGVVILLQRQSFRKKLRAIELQQKIQTERERISRDLHDSVGTQLSIISNNIEWIAYPLIDFTEAERTEKLKYLNQKSRDVIATLRESIWALNKEAVSLEEFSDKLKSYIQKQLVLYPSITLQYKETISQDLILSPNEALNLFRICQESITNSLKYAGATILQVVVEAKNDRYSILVADNGKGFVLGDKETLQGYGLENMRHRANEIDVELDIESAIGEGTRLTITKN